ncbi:MAG: hypothetical protein ACLQD9_07105 [Thermoplasmata archaeon]
MAASAGEAPRKFKEVDFTIAKEGWAIYELDDNVELRIRAIVTKLQRLAVEGTSEPQYAVSSAVLMNINAPLKYRKPPSAHVPTPDQIAASEKSEVAFRALDEPWNEYTFDDPDSKAIKAKLVVSGVMRLGDLFDNLGEPMYQVSQAVVVAPPVPRKVNPGR